MNKRTYFCQLLIVLGSICLYIGCQNTNETNHQSPTNMKNTVETAVAPIAKKVAKELTIHGDTRIDNYYWLNDREDQEVIDYLNEENAFTQSKLSHLDEFKDALFDEIVGRIKKDDSSVPYKKNGYFYIVRYEPGKEYPIYTRKKETLEADEEIMLDVNELAKGHDFYNAAGLKVSTNNQLMAFAEDTVSRRIYTLRFKDLETGEFLEDRIPNTSGSVAWANDNKTVFYTVKDESLRPYKVFKHVLGTDVSTDEEIYHESDETFLTYLYKSKSDQYIILGSYQTISSEFRLIDADQPNEPYRVFQPRERNLEYDIAHFEDHFYIRTNMDAKNFRLMKCPVDKTTKEHWTEVIPHRADVLLEDVDVFKQFIVLSERKNGITQLKIHPWNEAGHYIDFGEDAYMAYTSQNPEFDTEEVRIGYQSMSTPPTTYDYNVSTKSLTQLKQQEVVGDFEASNYGTERLFATAKDGTKVPISLVYKKSMFKKDGSAPLLLYAYGSYGNSMEPYFSSVRLSLLDRGFVYAIAHIRGGEEMGRHWYEDGKLLNKKNTFTDFVDCADFLVAEQYANKENLFAMGGSAGGLLMGAVVNMRPELWKGVIAAVPFVDVVTTMLDESIPLTTGEFDEWGNPKDKEYYDYIKSYSPYDNVEKKDYPNMMVTTGLHDSQVQYWEPAKWVAKLREYKTDDNLLLLHTNMEAGHGGASGRFEKHKETAMEYAFVLDLAGKVEVKD